MGAAAAVVIVPVRLLASTKSANGEDVSDQVIVTADRDIATGTLIIRARLLVYDGKLTHYHCDHPIKEDRVLTGRIPVEELACTQGVPIASKKYAVIYFVREESIDAIGPRLEEFVSDMRALAKRRVAAMPDELFCPEGGMPMQEQIPHALRRKYRLKERFA